eukprot:Platyproteum_vivax@DN8977_c0_g1_i1.p1
MPRPVWCWVCKIEGAHYTHECRKKWKHWPICYRCGSNHYVTNCTRIRPRYDPETYVPDDTIPKPRLERTKKKPKSRLNWLVVDPISMKLFLKPRSLGSKTNYEGRLLTLQRIRRGKNRSKKAGEEYHRPSKKNKKIKKLMREEKSSPNASPKKDEKSKQQHVSPKLKDVTLFYQNEKSKQPHKEKSQQQLDYETSKQQRDEKFYVHRRQHRAPAVPPAVPAANKKW